MDSSGDVPLALRRERRSNFGVRLKQEVDTAPESKTPQRSRSKRRVRFSDPELFSSGLTPMLSRTKLATPSSRRRGSTPATLLHNAASMQSSPSRRGEGTESLRHVLNGRVERHLRRTSLRTALDRLDSQHQRTKDHAKSQIAQLKKELRERDREVYELQNATIVIDTDRIWDLEQQVDDLQAQLKNAVDQQQQRRRNSHEQTTIIDWTMAARDPFEDRSDADTELIYDAGDEDHFGDATAAQLACSTPSRARASFPTPPATSPTMPALGTPASLSRFFHDMPATPSSDPVHMGVQVSLPDPAIQAQRDEMESLQRETRKLTTTLDTYKEVMERLRQRIAASSNATQQVDTADTCSEADIERQVDHLITSLAERTSSLDNIGYSIASLGFPGTDAPAMLTSLTAAFRTARLELEYLTPGEISLPLTSHGAEVLDLVLEQLRDLSRRVKEGDEAVDEYHSIEQSLRKQLDARVSAMDGLRTKLAGTEETLGQQTSKIQELEVGNDRLKGAIDGYLRDISELERLVERMEAEGRDKDESLIERQDTITDLETRLGEATKHATELKDELEVVQNSRKRQLDAVNRRSGDALALRDARVAELRGEIDRVNAALRGSYERIRRLRVDKSSVEDENTNLRDIVEGMKAELQRVVEMSEQLAKQPADAAQAHSETTGAVEGTPGNLLSGKLARRSSGRKRRRYDSGLGFLDEDEVDMF